MRRNDGQNPVRVKEGAANFFQAAEATMPAVFGIMPNTLLGFTWKQARKQEGIVFSEFCGNN
eukprot:92597-Amphidinium_carterae.1